MGWNDLAHRERQRNLVAKTLKWRVLGGTKNVDLWFVGPDCGSCRWNPGLGRERAGIRPARERRRAVQGRGGAGARAYQLRVVQESISLLGAKKLRRSLLVVGKISLRAKR